MIERDIFKTYISLINNSIDTKIFRNMFVSSVDGESRDVTQDGRLSCAYFVSSILVISSYLNRVHSTVEITISDFEKYKWKSFSEPAVGDVVEWPKNAEGHAHVGFYVGEGEAVSNSEDQRSPVRHSIIMKDGRKPLRYWRVPNLMNHNNLSKRPDIELGKYCHYKGGEYEVLMLVCNEASHEWMVVYRALYDTGDNPKTWARTYTDFTAELPDGRKRFEKVIE